jgi:hypothetical protein
MVSKTYIAHRGKPQWLFPVGKENLYTSRRWNIVIVAARGNATHAAIRPSSTTVNSRKTAVKPTPSALPSGEEKHGSGVLLCPVLFTDIYFSVLSGEITVASSRNHSFDLC